MSDALSPFYLFLSDNHQGMWVCPEIKNADKTPTQGDAPRVTVSLVALGFDWNWSVGQGRRKDGIEIEQQTKGTQKKQRGVLDALSWWLWKNPLLVPMQNVLEVEKKKMNKFVLLSVLLKVVHLLLLLYQRLMVSCTCSRSSLGYFNLDWVIHSTPRTTAADREERGGEDNRDSDL